MTTKELDDLIATLMKSGLANSKSEASEMAKKMIDTSQKVQKDTERRIHEQGKGINVEHFEEKKEEPIQEEIQEVAVEEPLTSQEWTEKATREIISNNDIMKTLDKIGRQEVKDPNQNLTNTEKTANRYEKIENLYAEKKESGNWLPSTPRAEVKYGSNGVNTSFNQEPVEEKKEIQQESFTQEPEVQQKPILEPQNAEMDNTENENMTSEMQTENPISESINTETESQNVETEEPNTESQNVKTESQNAESQISPEDYTAMRMQGSLNDLMTEHQEVPETENSTQTVESEQEPVQEDFTKEPEVQQESIPNEPIKENIQQEYRNVESKPKEDANLDINVTTSEEENPSEFLQMKDQFAPPKEPEEEIEEKPKEEEKKGRWTEEEEKLKEQVDLSKVFNFGNRG